MRAATRRRADKHYSKKQVAHRRGSISADPNDPRARACGLSAWNRFGIDGNQACAPGGPPRVPISGCSVTCMPARQEGGDHDLRAKEGGKAGDALGVLPPRAAETSSTLWTSAEPRARGSRRREAAPACEPRQAGAQSCMIAKKLRVTQTRPSRQSQTTRGRAGAAYLLGTCWASMKIRPARPAGRPECPSSSPGPGSGSRPL